MNTQVPFQNNKIINFAVRPNHEHILKLSMCFSLPLATDLVFFFLHICLLKQHVT